MKEAKPPRERPEYVYVRWWDRCPWCDKRTLERYKTRQGGDGSAARYTKCSRCGRHVVVVVE
jgi:hypothetical protein